MKPEMLAHAANGLDKSGREILDILAVAIIITDANAFSDLLQSSRRKACRRTPQVGVDRWCITWKIYQPDGSCPITRGTHHRGRGIPRGAARRRPLLDFVSSRHIARPTRQSFGALNMLVDITALRVAQTEAECAAQWANSKGSKAMLYSYPAGFFTYFQEVSTPLVEGLVIPMFAGGQPIGAVWIVAHDETRNFHAGDARIWRAANALSKYTQIWRTWRMRESQPYPTSGTRDHGILSCLAYRMECISAARGTPWLLNYASMIPALIAYLTKQPCPGACITPVPEITVEFV